MQVQNPFSASFKTAIALATGLALPVSLPAVAEEWPAPIQQIEQEGVTIHGEFDAPGGLKGYAASINGKPVAAYLTPDGEHAVLGTLIDAQGQNIASATLEQIVYGEKNTQLWQQMADHHWVRDGDADAPRIIYTFSDPNCPYCRQFWEDIQPWVESGEVQVRHLMVGILKADSLQKAASLLAADDPSAAITEHYRSDAMPDNAGSDQSEQWASENTQLMQDAQIFATPATFYRDGDDVHRIMGAPRPDQLRAITGSETP